ncbi:sigma-70 family RNA polymerase sigma factor [Paraliomyxa miuraensis]|uniref:sigma-70 family RNA polymerase sigma factor n=1 Tax=Paraliomyxa miuraensis TaxID=376150 RepID=UPI00225C029E|nr:sigma-70 family RNA polymerase sigma factor [Paraliomyxa miuraensis]MCX4240544.1 sigma-70 family RNA polymerase sigma factor [Paraliomyxa miuraensis]
MTPKDIARMLDGGPGAREPLFRTLITFIHKEAARHLSRFPETTKDDVLDLVHDVCVALLENDGRTMRAWNPLRGRNLESYIRMVTRCRLISRDHKALRRLPAAPIMRLDEAQPADDAKNPEDSFANAMLLQRIMDELDGELGDRDRLLFHLLYVEQVSSQEAGALADMTEGAINTWKHRLKHRVAKIRDRLQ